MSDAATPPTLSFSEAIAWLASETNKEPNLLLGNGYSMSYDHTRFAYGALADSAQLQGKLPDIARSLIDSTGISDFETIMRQLDSTIQTLRALDPNKHSQTIDQIDVSIVELREALVHAIAGLHPDRPYEIEASKYLKTRRFLDRFQSIYTVSYDLLLYWALMQELPKHPSKSMDDGFRDSGLQDDNTVKWDLYKGDGQRVHYLHGALHLYQAMDGLRKITWSRTDLPLIDQVRQQLESGRYPVFISEGKSIEKFDKINRNAYLSRSLRSLGNCTRPLVIFGHSLDDNDSHILESIVRSRVSRVAVSLYGDKKSNQNREVIKNASALAVDRAARTPNNQLAIRFFDAESAEAW